MSFVDSVKTYIQSNRVANRAVMALYMRTAHPASIYSLARAKGLTVRFRDVAIDVARANKVVRVSRKHAIYLKDVVENFDFYFGAVAPIVLDATEWVDYSTPRYHDVIGYDRHPILFPSLAEPILTTNQYLDFAQLKPGSISLDLGAYSGLTSILMRDLSGDGGRVVAVDADGTNLRAIKNNFALYERLTGRHIDLIEAAVWTHNDGITFSSEGNMGSSATDFVGDRLGAALRVPSIKLSTIVERFVLPRVDFIKCDIEGAEAVIFDDPVFFAENRPRMIVEVHRVKGEMSSRVLSQILGRFSYRCVEVAQPGSDLPLLECLPTA